MKVERTRSFGAEVVLHGDTLDEARGHALQLAEQQQLTFVHPYDDEAIIAGQGTVGSRCWRPCRSSTRWWWPSAAAA